MGKVIDVIYSASEDGSMLDQLTRICKILLAVFLLGAAANFGRVYLMSVAGELRLALTAFLYV